MKIIGDQNNRFLLGGESKFEIEFEPGDIFVTADHHYLKVLIIQGSDWWFQKLGGERVLIKDFLSLENAKKYRWAGPLPHDRVYTWKDAMDLTEYIMPIKKGK